MAKNMSEDKQLEMLEALEEVQEAFPFTLEGFLLFAQTCINLLIPGNPDLNRLQADICKWLFLGPKFRMVQAQRG
jgi:2'-5' RNA ligase